MVLAIKKVITFGVFDPLHKGHKSLFQQSKEYGSILLVVVARDSWIRAVKGREPFVKEEGRLENVQKDPCVDEAVLGYEWPPDDKYGLLRELDFEVVVLGYDQPLIIEEVKKELRSRGKGGVKVVRLKSYMPQKYKSSFLR